MNWLKQTVVFLSIMVLVDSVSLGANWKIIQLTDNEVHDRGPKVSQGQVVWYSHVESDNEIFWYDGFQIRQLTDNTFDDMQPRIHVGDPNVTICWYGQAAANRTNEIYASDGTSVVRLTTNDWDDREAVCSADQIVWRQQNGKQDWEILHYTPAGGVESITSDDYQDQHPSVYGSWIAWVKNGQKAREIWLHDGQESRRIADSDTVFDSGPSVGDHHVTWMQWIDDNWEVFHYQGQSYQRLTFGDMDHFAPVVCGERIAWRMNDGNDNELMYHDGTYLHQITFDEDLTSDESVRMDGQWIVSLRKAAERTDIAQIVVYDTMTRLGTVLACPFDQNSELDIRDGVIVWQAFDGNDYEIMMAVACDEMAGDVNGDCTVNLEDLAQLAGDWTNCALPEQYCP
ncbi:MAG: hypothetical protein JXA82_09880 [Sedimentisphaerales bacterium]|nr:hypothetical protein [Sedimentisphaerales bacterium]